LDEETQKLSDWLRDNPNATAEEIQKKKDEFAKKIEPVLEKAKKRKDFSDFLGNLRKRIDDENDSLSHLSPDDKKKILDNIHELNEWLKANPNASVEEIENKIKEFEKKNREILDRAENIGKFEKDITNKKRLADGDLADFLNTKDKKKLISDLQDGSDWLNENIDQKPSVIEKERIKCEESTNPIIEKAKLRKDLSDTVSNMKKRFNDPNDPISLLSSDDKKKIEKCS